LNKFGKDRNLIQSIIEISNKSKNRSEIEKYQLDAMFLSLTIRGSLIQFIGDEQKALFNKKTTIEYLIYKLNETVDLKLRLRYLYLIWNSQSKHNKYFNSIVKATKSLIGNQKFILSDFDDYLVLENYACLVYKTESEADSLFESLNSQFLNKQTEAIPFKFLLLESLVTLKKFDFSRISRLESILIEIFDYFVIKHDTIIAERVLRTATSISSKLNLSVEKWYDKTGEIFEKHADFRLNDARPLVSLNCYISAKEFYQKSNNTIKSKEIEGKLNEVKKRKVLDRVPGLGISESDAVRIYEESRNTAKEILQLDKSEIFDYIFNLSNLLPAAKESNNKNFNDKFKLFKKSEFDLNQNIFSRGNSKNLIFSPTDLAIYNQLLKIKVIPIFDRLIIDGFINKKFSKDDFVEEFKRRTWFSVKFLLGNLGGGRSEFNWMEIITPSFELLFDIMDEVIGQKDSSENKLVLIVDSLALKVEGLLRQILQSNNFPTTKQVRNVSQEQTLEDLIDHTFIMQKFIPKEITYMKFVITRQGLNLRNNVSHAYFKSTKHYNWKQVLHLILLLIIIGKQTNVDGT